MQHSFSTVELTPRRSRAAGLSYSWHSPPDTCVSCADRFIDDAHKFPVDRNAWRCRISKLSAPLWAYEDDPRTHWRKDLDRSSIRVFRNRWFFSDAVFYA